MPVSRVGLLSVSEGRVGARLHQWSLSGLFECCVGNFLGLVWVKLLKISWQTVSWDWEWVDDILPMCFSGPQWTEFLRTGAWFLLGITGEWRVLNVFWVPRWDESLREGWLAASWGTWWVFATPVWVSEPLWANFLGKTAWLPLGTENEWMELPGCFWNDRRLDRATWLVL